MGKQDKEKAEWIANSYDGDKITIEDIITACMGMANWKERQMIAWLKENLYHYIGFEFVLDTEIEDATNLIIKDFKQAMKEE